jgi:adenylate kinase
MTRAQPNIVVTGTPGTGKTTLAEELARRIPELRHVSVNEVARDRECRESYDEALQSWVVDEEKVLDAVEDMGAKEKGGFILDWHACDLWPESWVDLVVVLRVETRVLFDRLTERWVIRLHGIPKLPKLRRGDIGERIGSLCCRKRC